MTDIAYKKANVLNRFIAKTIDLLIFGFLSQMFYPFGFFAGILYILIADGFFDGQSIGKRLIGLKVISVDLAAVPESDEKLIEFKESMIRNSFLAGALLLSLIPLVGWFLLFTVGLFVYAMEIYFVIQNHDGERLGDRFAFTRVIDFKRKQLKEIS